MSEPFATYLMPTYATFSWLLLLYQSYKGLHSYLLPISLIGWIWALINILKTKRLDLGIVTFGIVVLGTLSEIYVDHKHKQSASASSVGGVGENVMGRVTWIKWWITLGCMLVAANFSLVVIFWDSISKELQKTKSSTWLKVFLSYCIVMMMFWIVAACRNHVYARGDGSSSYDGIGGKRSSSNALYTSLEDAHTQ